MGEINIAQNTNNKQVKKITLREHVIDFVTEHWLKNNTGVDGNQIADYLGDEYKLNKSRPEHKAAQLADNSVELGILCKYQEIRHSKNGLECKMNVYKPSKNHLNAIANK